MRRWYSCVFTLLLWSAIFKKDFTHRRVRINWGGWQNIREAARRIDFEALFPRELTVYLFRDEIVRKMNRWIDSGMIEKEEISSLMVIAKSLGMSSHRVIEGLSTEEKFKGLLDEIIVHTLQKLVEIIQEGNVRYYKVLGDISFPILPYLKDFYNELIDDIGEEAVEKRKIVLAMALQDTVSTDSELAEFFWGVVTSKNKNVSQGEKELALKGIASWGTFEMFVKLLDYLPQSKKLGIAREKLDRVVNLMAERILGEENQFENPFQLARMVKERGSVILRIQDGRFIEVDNFVSTWIPGVWLIFTVEPRDIFLKTWRALCDILAVAVDWSGVRDYIPPSLRRY